MATAYVDTSALVAVAFGEPSSFGMGRRLDQFQWLVSSNFLEAEVRSAFRREDLAIDRSVLFGIEWVYPDRPLTHEFESVLDAGYLRGADLWHVATALYVAQDPGDITFLTLDARQQAVALALGFQT